MNKLVRFDPSVELNALERQYFGDDWFTPLKGINMPATDVYTKDNQPMSHFTDYVFSMR
jgi:hypothetical protein